MNFPIFNLENIYFSDAFKIEITNNQQNHNILRIYNLKLSTKDKIINNDDVKKSKFNIGLK